MGKPWEQQAKESPKAFDAFQVYRDMGAERSLEAVGQRLGKSKALMERWSARWQWVKRCTAYDQHLARQEEQVKAQALREEAVKWARRRTARREKEWETSEALRKRAEQMMAFPLAQTISEDGRTIVMPAKWSLRDVAAYLAMSSKLAQQALGDEGESEVESLPHPTPALPISEEQRTEAILVLLERAQARRDSGAAKVSDGQNAQQCA